MKVNEFAVIEAHKLGFVEDEEDFYMRIVVPGAMFVQWYKPLFGRPVWGFELITDHRQVEKMEAAFHAYREEMKQDMGAR